METCNPFYREPDPEFMVLLGLQGGPGTQQDLRGPCEPPGPLPVLPGPRSVARPGFGITGSFAKWVNGGLEVRESTGRCQPEEVAVVSFVGLSGFRLYPLLLICKSPFRRWVS